MPQVQIPPEAAHFFSKNTASGKLRCDYTSLIYHACVGDALGRL